MRGVSSDRNLEIIPLTLTLSPRFAVRVLSNSFAGERGQIAVCMNPSFEPDRRIRIHRTPINRSEIRPRLLRHDDAVEDRFQDLR